MPDVLNALTGGRIDVPQDKEAFVSLIVILIAIWVADRIRAKLFPDAAEQVLALEKERLLTEAAGGAAVSRGAMKEAVETVIAKKSGTTDEALVKRVARAICDELEGPVNNQDFARQSRQWKLAQRLARAAIAAIRLGDKV